jgi:hypothetical protein
MIVLLTIIGLIVLTASRETGNTRGGGNSLARQLGVSSTQPMTVNVISVPFTVAPGQYAYYTFKILPHATNVHIEGTFQASGGGGNDIEAFLLDDDQFVNFQNHHSSPTYYNSGKITRGSIDRTLPSTDSEAVTYHMVFNNSFSLLTNKVVDGTITVHYDRSF